MPQSATDNALAGVTIKNGEASDIAFVRAKTLHDLEYFWPYRSKFEGEIVFRQFNKIFPQILKRSQLLVAERHGSILAYVVFSLDEPLVYLCHTARGFRRLGLCRALLAGVERPFRFTFDNDLASKTAKKLGGQFDPFALVSLFER